MSITAGIHDPQSFTPHHSGPHTWVNIDEASVFVTTTAQCDEAIKAFVLAKSMILGETSPADGHAFVRPGQVAPGRPTPDRCMVCGEPEAAHSGPSYPGSLNPLLLPEAEASPANPYGSADAVNAQTAASEPFCAAEMRPPWGGLYICTEPVGHDGDHVAGDDGAEYQRWPQAAGSAAEVAEGVDDISPLWLPRDDAERDYGQPHCAAADHIGRTCTRPEGHDGDHVAHGTEHRSGAPTVCNRWPQAPTGHLAQHAHGEPGCTYTGCTEHGAAVTR